MSGYTIGSQWSQDDDIFLRDSWGKVPASKIGEALGGRSKNSVLGRAHRLGLGHLISPYSPRKPVNSDKRSTQKREYARARYAANKAGVPFTKQERQEAVGAAVGECPTTTLPALEALRAIADEPFKHEVLVMPPTFVKPPPPRPSTFLKGGECCWPIGDPKSPDFKFCCEPTEFGKSYCRKHRKIAYVPRTRPVEVG